MRSVRLFRNEKLAFALRPFWDSCRPRNFGRTCLVTKKTGTSEPDPYEGNYSFLECDQYAKVTVIGAAGRVGKTLSLLLKTCPLIDHLCLFDINKAVKGIGVDISHIDTKCCVSYVCGMRNIQQALDGPDVVVIAAGCPASPSLFGKKLFDKNAPIIAGLSEACARFCPKACLVLITSPINSLLPVVGEVYQTITNRVPMRKMFGLTTLDVVRANTFVAEVIRKDPNSIIVPVIGGASQETIVPVISQMKPCCKIKRGEMLALTECIKRAEGNLTDCQNCGTRGASSLSTAYSAFRFTTSLVMALKGAEDIVECAFVKSDVIPELEYLASPVKLGIRGIEHNYGYPPLSDYELAGLEQAAASLVTDINLGKSFVSSIEETIRQGLIWKRLTEDALKTEKSPGLVRNVKDSVVKRKRVEQRQKREENRKEELREANEDSSPVLEKGVMYTHSVDWAVPAKTSLKRLLHSDEATQQEMATESISAEVDGCRGDPSLHEKFFENLKLKDQPSIGEINQAGYSASVEANRLPELNFLQARNINTQLVRNIHTMGKKKSNFEERNFRRKKQDNFKQYIIEDRKMIQEHTMAPEKSEEAVIPKLKTIKSTSFDETSKAVPWENKYAQSQYKGLNFVAKQKIRSYNCQKKFNPSASVLLMLERRRREKAEKSLVFSAKERIREKEAEEDREKMQKEEEKMEDEKEAEDADDTLLIFPEKVESAKHRDFVIKQLNDLKKENDLLKKRLFEISKEKKLETALQIQSDNLELERTKLKACWLIMTSTIDAFSNFCKKFTSKVNSKTLEEAVHEMGTGEEDENEMEEYEDASDQIQQKEEKAPKVDDKYFQFLQKLMDDQMGSSKARKTM